MTCKLMKVDGRKYSLITAIVVTILVLFMYPLFLFGFLFGEAPQEEGVSGIINIVLWFMPLVYFVFTYLGTRIFMGLFNLVIRWTGGFKIEIDVPGTESTDVLES